ncbi:hypothetical protein [Erythrobacter mangrovi]|uniref:DUF2306 domain-containing protein n=1 Tax=Erythrobacter mangrovi TaxID=2739433 RepID=A0A7D3XYG3_9SPHN|nr:hypothetical protein [Erythrobacter mangrovi]QKG70512.1 hypothetical protein HQR01_03535 [Erythrobacter mangrovi]
MDTRFAARHSGDSRFWAALWIYILLIVLLGFREPVTERFFDDFQEPASVALQLHVWSFAAWLVLLAMQAGLAATGRMDWHRKFGLAMLPLAALMVLSAGVAEFAAQQREVANGNSGAFSAFTIFYLVPFAVLVPLAWRARTNPPAHKRLILMATATICAGAHLRTVSSFDPTLFWASDNYFTHLFIGFGGSMLIIAIGMAWDLYSRGALHPVYRVGAPILFTIYAVAAWVYGTESYGEATKAFLGGG